MLLDDFLPRFDFQSKHELLIEAPVERVWTSVLSTDFSKLRMVRFLFLLRGYTDKLPAAHNLMEDIRPYGFLELAARQYQEIVIGGIGKPWQKSGAFVHGLDTDRYLDFAEPGYVRIIANLSLVPKGRHSTTLSTETRAQATDEKARAHFAPYWALIKKPSGWIRSAVLKDIAARSL